MKALLTNSTRSNMSVELRDYQLDVIEKLHNGSILCGGVGSGKSRTAIGYYLFKVCKGRVKVNGVGSVQNMQEPRDLYIITTAKKRDSNEWYGECGSYMLFKDAENSLNGVKVIVDSWNNIQKYQDIFGAFFIFDEQRLVGRGAWVKSFLKISRKNQWILLTATPGDQWSDYVPVFVANGFFKNRSEFNRLHCVFSPYTKFPKIDKYVGTKRLEAFRDSITIKMSDQRNTVRHYEIVDVEYNRSLYRTIFRNRWDPYENRPIEEVSKLCYLLRRVCNEDVSRIEAVDQIVKKHKRCIVFYNFTYELNILRSYADQNSIKYKEWNGEKHQELPKGDSWLYLVQYNAGCEGWNCITTDTVILFSQNYSYRVLEQACGRIDRMNTPFVDLYYYRLKSSSPIDSAIYDKLKDKKNFNDSSISKSVKM